MEGKHRGCNPFVQQNNEQNSGTLRENATKTTKIDETTLEREIRAIKKGNRESKKKCTKQIPGK